MDDNLKAHIKTHYKKEPVEPGIVNYRCKHCGAGLEPDSNVFDLHQHVSREHPHKLGAWRISAPGFEPNKVIAGFQKNFGIGTKSLKEFTNRPKIEPIVEESPPGWSKTVEAMKNTGMSDKKAFSLAWYMFKKGKKPRYKE